MTSLSRLKSSTKFFQRLKPSVPEKLKGGRLEKIGKYFHNIYDDYRIVFKEIIQDCKDRPLKASVYGSLLITGFIMLKTNPSHDSFKSEVIECSNALSTVGEPIRNPISDQHVTKMVTAVKDNALSVWNFRFFTLVFLKEYPVNSALFEATCSYVKPHWTEWYKSVVDVGVFGDWIYLNNAMKEYDVNPDEWLPDGQPKVKTRILPPD